MTRRKPQVSEERKRGTVPEGTVPPSDPERPTQAELEERIAALEAERDEYLADLKRVAADFDNYRKRALRDQESLIARAHERLAKELLPVLDDLERALQAAAQHEEAAAEPPVRDSGPGEGVRGNFEAEHKGGSEAADAGARQRRDDEGVNREVPPGGRDPVGAHDVFEGIRLVHRSLRAALEKEGLVEIETDGRFDPHVHEALLTQPSEEDEGTIIDVIQKGYRLGDRVLRPARVVVAAPKEVAERRGDDDR